MFDFLITTRRSRDTVLAKHELSPNDSKAMLGLDPVVGRTMGSLAGDWMCDASNATWMVDRLETRGFAERRPAPGDRRVKMVVLTPLGVKVRNEVLAELYQPPPELLELGRDEIEALRDALARLKTPDAIPRAKVSG